MRRRRGSAIAELGPALFMFMIIIFFPLLDVMGMAAQYSVGWYHNHLMLQELPVRLETDANQVHNEVTAKFGATGMSKFANITNITDTTDYSNKPTNGQPWTVKCTTRVEGRPFIAIPFLNFTKTEFTFFGEATREVKDRNLT